MMFVFMCLDLLYVLKKVLSVCQKEEGNRVRNLHCGVDKGRFSVLENRVCICFSDRSGSIHCLWCGVGTTEAGAIQNGNLFSRAFADGRKSG